MSGHDGCFEQVSLSREEYESVRSNPRTFFVARVRSTSSRRPSECSRRTSASGLLRSSAKTLPWRRSSIPARRPMAPHSRFTRARSRAGRHDAERVRDPVEAEGVVVLPVLENVREITLLRGDNDRARAIEDEARPLRLRPCRKGQASMAPAPGRARQGSLRAGEALRAELASADTTQRLSRRRRPTRRRRSRG